MQPPLLIYFKEAVVEFWSIDQNKRLIPINCGANNIAPLYFFVSGDQISMDQNAKMQFDSNADNSYGNYWINILNTQLKYNRFNTSYSFSTLLSYAIKENILPDIIRYNFSSFTRESFLNTCKTIIFYDSFIDEQHRNRINKELIEVVGFNPSSLVTFDYWELYRDYYEKKGSINPKESLLSINSALGDLNINLVAQNPTLTINKKTLSGRGNDPRIDTILEYVAEIAVKKGSQLPINEIKKKIASNGPAILSLLKEGWVSYKIRNHEIGIYPLNLDFHKEAVENRLNNRSALNFIQSEFDVFRNANQASSYKIFISGEIMNQEVFINFFKSNYSNVVNEDIDFTKVFLLFIFDYMEMQSIVKPQKSTLLYITPPKVTSPPPLPQKTTTSPSIPTRVASAPPLPPMLTAPPPIPPKHINGNENNKTSSAPQIKVPPIIKPDIKLPPIIKEVKKTGPPPPPRPTLKSMVPPPPPPPPPIKKK